jgi:hypothetical protein
MASIQRITSSLTGEISYRAQVRIKGQRAQSQTFPNRKEAQQWANSIETSIRENRFFPQAKASRLTFRSIAERYLRDSIGKSRRVRAGGSQAAA